MYGGIRPPIICQDLVFHILLKRFKRRHSPVAAQKIKPISGIRRNRLRSTTATSPTIVASPGKLQSVCENNILPAMDRSATSSDSFLKVLNIFIPSLAQREESFLDNLEHGRLVRNPNKLNPDFSTYSVMQFDAVRSKVYSSWKLSIFGPFSKMCKLMEKFEVLQVSCYLSGVNTNYDDGFWITLQKKQ